MTDLVAELTDPGFAVLQPGHHPFTDADIATLVQRVDGIPREAGIGEDNRVEVGRLRIDPVDEIRAELGYPGTVIADAGKAVRAMEIIERPDAMSWWSTQVSIPEVKVARAQVNVLAQDGFVGVHRDEESNQEYLVSVVLGLSSEFAGGDLVFDTAHGERHVAVTRGTLVVSRPDIADWVEPLEWGSRMSLVFFLVRAWSTTSK